MILHQNPVTNHWTDFGEGIALGNVHSGWACEGRGCAIHSHPSDHRLNAAPLNWREDRGILERICKHGVGHPDHDAATYLVSIGQGFENIHGCDGCCASRENAQNGKQNGEHV